MPRSRQSQLTDRIVLRVTQEQDAMIGELSEKLSLPQTAVIRLALDYYFAAVKQSGSDVNKLLMNTAYGEQHSPHFQQQS
jgi:hypothetical protein